MARYRSRSRSYSPRRRSRTPPRGRKRYDDDPRDRYHDQRFRRDRRSPAPSGLLIRNLPLDARPEDLRIPFERFGQVKDVYLPKNYYTGEPRGFGFVKFRYAEDAAEAKQRMNHQVIGGREIRIVFAEENRKTPHEMRTSSRMSDRYGGSYRRTPPRSPRRRYRSYSHSPSPIRHDSRGREVRDDYRSPRRSRSISRDRAVKDDYRSPTCSRSVSKSYSPRDEREYRSNYRSPSPRGNDYGPHDEREYRSNYRSPSLRGNGRGPHDEMDHAASRSRSLKGESCSPSRSRS